MTDKAPLTESTIATEELLSTVLPEAKQFHSPIPQTDSLSRAITQSASDLLKRQDNSGWWSFDLEADATISSEYMLLQHFLGSVDEGRESRLVDYLRSRQMAD